MRDAMGKIHYLRYRHFLMLCPHNMILFFGRFCILKHTLLL